MKPPSTNTAAIVTPTTTTPVVIICPGNGCTNIRRSNWYGRLHDELTAATTTTTTTPTGKIRCVCENFPDPIHARRDIWVPHIRSLVERETSTTTSTTSTTTTTTAEATARVVLVGHSSGAQAVLRYAEEHPVHACVLVAATYSDLGDAHERASGYYPQPATTTTTRRTTNNDDDDDDDDETAVVNNNNPYLFSKMKKHCKHWHQFHSDDDPFIPLCEAEKIRDGLGLSFADGTASSSSDDDDDDNSNNNGGTYHMLPGRSHFFDFSPELLECVLSVCGMN